MTLLGLVGMIDPPRPEARGAIGTCEPAGIRVVMITGDHPLTARAVARELGLLKDGRVVTGAELDAMGDASSSADVEPIDVYARVSPAHKLRVVERAAGARPRRRDDRRRRQRRAGAAARPTSASRWASPAPTSRKEAAAMTLTDDNFASIVAAVEEGRGVFGNIKKYLMYLLVVRTSARSA